MIRHALVPFVILIAGCSTIRVKTEVAPGADLGRYRTYAWMEAYNRGPETIVDQQVRAALQRQLTEKGLRETSVEDADFLVRYHVLQERKMAVSDWGNGLYGWAPDVVSYTDGSLIVDFVDPRTNRVVWRGSATSAIESPGVVNLGRLEKASSEIVRRFPITPPSHNVATAK